MKKLILIDGHAIVHRAFHALPPLTSSKGLVTNAVYGFSSILIKMIKDIKPDYIAATFDLNKPTFRHEEFAEYKIHRAIAPSELTTQIPLVQKMLEAFGIPIFEKEGYEADDVIGTLAVKAKKEKDLQVIIATGDLDTLQLVDDKKVVVFTMKKGVTDTVIYDEEMVKERYELDPEQLNDYKGLKGDPSDNIPGVPGIGEKTAATLIKEFGSLENLYEKLEKSKTVSEKLKQKLLENKEKAFFSKQLSTIVTDLDIDFDIERSDWQKHMNLSKIEEIFKDLNFFSLVKRLPELGQQGLDLTPGPVRQTPQTKDQDPNHIYVFPSTNLDPAYLFDEKITIIGHDVKEFVKQALKDKALERSIKCSFFDTKIVTYLLNPGYSEYDFERTYYAEFKSMPSEDMPASLFKLKERLEKKLAENHLNKIWEDIERPLIPVMAKMELTGIKVDTKKLATLLKTTVKEVLSLEKKIYKLAGTEFNINSPSQLSDVLFNKMHITPPASHDGRNSRIKKTSGGAMSTAASELEKLIDAHPIIELILNYRELQKLKNTYIEPFPLLVQKDGRVHTTYDQTGAATGRLSSQNPNLQNIPVRTELGQQFRKAFIADNDYLLASFDYGQLELRIAAHVANDQAMIKAFRNGDDIHTRTAAEIFEVPPDKVTKEMRRQAKVLNFGIIYGMGVLGFARAAGVDRQRAREFIDKYFKEFSGVAKYMEDIKSKAHKDGYVETLLGRRRWLLDIRSTMPQVQAQAERMAINHPIQGTEADIVKLAMIKLQNFIEKECEPGDIRMLLQVHDEIVFEIKEEKTQKIIPEIKKIMESAYQLDVPLTVDAKIGPNWQDAEKVLI